ncbi:unnamed protein product [Parajaminaea phylloscopi]
MVSSLPKSQTQVHLVGRPGAKPIDESILANVEVPLDVPSPLPQGQVLVKVQLLSLDPSMRPSMNPDKKSYRPPAPLNSVFWAGGIGKILASNHPDFKEGDKVLSGSMNAQEYSVVDVEAARKTGYFSKIDPSKGIDEKEYLGALWGTGLAAWLGLVEVAKVKKGDRVLVSGAAGATGGLVIQLAKLKGASYVVGVAGGPEKKRYVVEQLGADECIDYRDADYERQIAKLSDREEGGIDLYFDNVGGSTLDAALLAMNPAGRVACCGAISGYSGSPQGLRNAHVIVQRRLSLQGYIAFPTFWPQEVWQGAIANLAGLAAQKKIHTRFHFHDKVGAAHFREALVALFEGKNQGKMLLQVDSEWKDDDKSRL